MSRLKLIWLRDSNLLYWIIRAIRNRDWLINLRIQVKLEILHLNHRLMRSLKL